MGDTDSEIAEELQVDQEWWKFKDERQPTAEEILRPTFRSSWLTPEEEALLSAPFPPHAYNTYFARGEYTTVKAAWITRRLNQVFGLGNVKYITKFGGIHKALRTSKNGTEEVEYVFVEGEMIFLGAERVVRHTIKYNGFWEIGGMSLTDAYKSAETNARNKALNNELGIGMECWMGLVSVEKSKDKYNPKILSVSIADELEYLPESDKNNNDQYNSGSSRSSSGSSSRSSGGSSKRSASSSKREQRSSSSETGARSSSTRSQESSERTESESADKPNTASELYDEQRNDLVSWVTEIPDERSKRQEKLKMLFPPGVEKTKDLTPEQMNEVHSKWSDKYMNGEE